MKTGTRFLSSAYVGFASYWPWMAAEESVQLYLLLSEQPEPGIMDIAGHRAWNPTNFDNHFYYIPTSAEL
jgi:hypothetical protein